jgi:hypothetical protein
VAAGFRVVDEGNFLRNPNDPRDKNTPDPPQPKDEFVLKFMKPSIRPGESRITETVLDCTSEVRHDNSSDSGVITMR